MEYLLETQDVVKQYAHHLALDKVSIQVPEGKIFALSESLTALRLPTAGMYFLTDTPPGRKMFTKSGIFLKSADCTRR